MEMAVIYFRYRRSLNHCSCKVLSSDDWVVRRTVLVLLCLWVPQAPPLSLNSQFYSGIAELVIPSTR